MTRLLILLLLVSPCSIIVPAFAQSYGLSDGRNTHSICEECQKIIGQKPREVLFGIHILDNDVYFAMGSETWFNKIFTKETDGITADIVSKDQFDCDQPPIPEQRLPRGRFLKPVLLQELKQRMERFEGGSIRIRLGTLPPELRGKEIEGNFVVVRNNMVCHYMNFSGLQRSLWQLLDMGLYADSLFKREGDAPDNEAEPDYFYYNRKIVVTIPFLKGAATFTPKDIQPLYDSLQLEGYTVRKIHIRAFSSVEGAEEVNRRLQQKRAESIIKAIQSFQKREMQTEVQTGENWVEFMQELSQKKDAGMAGLSNEEIKTKLRTDKNLAASFEPMLSRQRKAVITIYMDYKTVADDISNQQLIAGFKDAMAKKDMKKAAAIQLSVFERIRDNQLPTNFLDMLEIPMEKEFSPLLMNRAVYRHLLNETVEYEAIQNLQQLETLDPTNGKIKYNLYALQMRLWQYNDSLLDKNDFLQKIKKLPAYGIADHLVNRMLLNYKIILCEIYYKHEDYAAKDKTLLEVKQSFLSKDFTDRDLLSLGKYLCWYGQVEWADELISPRMDKLEVDEDLLFFYLNLSFFTQKDFSSQKFDNMMLNAISINKERFCQFFNSTELGGVSMQLLLDPFWKKIYCDKCRTIKLEKNTSP